MDSQNQAVAPEQPKASVGRIVHYVLQDRYGYVTHRPAIIVRNWNEEGASTEEGFVQLQVFTDGPNDGEQYKTGLYWATSVHHDENEKHIGTWHWPERV